MSQVAKSHVWIDVAEDRAEVQHNPKIYIGAGLASALVLGSLLNPLTALAALAYGLYMAWEANEANSDQIEAVEDGIIAHLLDERQLRQYVNEVGMPQVQMELRAAAARELQLSDAAEALMKGKARYPLALPPTVPAPAPEQPQEQPSEQTPTDSTPTMETTRGNIGTNTRIGAIAVPTAPVNPQPAVQQWDEDEPLEVTQGADDLAKLREALGYPAVLIFGASGAGKSTMAQWFIYERVKLGHSVEILDPHVAYGQWEGLPVYGAGLDYSACDERLGAFANLVQSRYQALAKRPDFNPRPHTLLTEEFTQWASHCPRAAGFFSSSMSDLRKVNMFALYVAHGKTLTSLGGSSGTAQQRDASLLMIELDTKMGPEGRPVPAGRGRIYYPGRHNHPVEIVVPDLSRLPAEQSAPSNLEAAYNADSPDEAVATVREILIKAEEPLKASQIRQKSRAFKDGMELPQLEALLERMALEGFIRQLNEAPPRFTVQR